MVDRFLLLLFTFLTSPGRRLANPSAAVLKPGGSPKPDVSRVCISANPGTPWALVWRWRTLMTSSRRSSILLCNGGWKPWTKNQMHNSRIIFISLTYLDNILFDLSDKKEKKEQHGLTMVWMPLSKLGEGVAWPEERAHWDAEPGEKDEDHMVKKVSTELILYKHFNTEVTLTALSC